jgi:hypothetical protein
MRVRVKNISNDEGGLRVVFSSQFGEAAAVWHGSTPKVGQEYDVELETGELRRWGTPELDVAETSDVEIREEEGDVVVQAYLETAQPDGYTVLRFGQTQDAPSLVVETDGEAPPRGQLVRVRVRDLSAWDQHF